MKCGDFWWIWWFFKKGKATVPESMEALGHQTPPVAIMQTRLQTVSVDMTKFHLVTTPVHYSVLPPYIRTRLGEIEVVQVHYLGPRRDKVFHKLLLRVRARIDFRERPKLGM